MRLNNFFDEIRYLAKQNPKEEICGFLLYNGLGSLEVYPSINCSIENRAGSFEIPATDYLKAVKTKLLYAVYHSHVNDPAKLSDADIRMANIAQVPFLVYSLQDDKFDYYRPESCIAPYEFRNFTLLASDCVTLVYDYCQKEFGVSLPYAHRTPQTLVSGFNGVASIAEHAGFRRVDSFEPQDILFISLGEIVGAPASAINHLAIYLGEDVILHQMMGEQSSKRRYSDNLKKKTKFIYRKDKILPVKL